MPNDGSLPQPSRGHLVRGISCLSLLLFALSSSLSSSCLECTQVSLFVSPACLLYQGSVSSARECLRGGAGGILSVNVCLCLQKNEKKKRGKSSATHVAVIKNKNEGREIGGSMTQDVSTSYQSSSLWWVSQLSYSMWQLERGASKRAEYCNELVKLASQNPPPKTRGSWCSVRNT